MCKNERAKGRWPSVCNLSGFTLIELLVVIAIIGVLTAVLLPALAAAKTKAKVTMARMEMASLISAVEHYMAEYSRYPCSASARKSTADNPDCKDFTYGTTLPDGSLLRPDYPKIHTYNQRFTYQTCNSELIAALRPSGAAPTKQLADLAMGINPRKGNFLDTKASNDANSPGIGPDGVFRDPWGNPYIVTIDVDEDGRTVDGFYGLLRKTAQPPLTPDISTGVLVWSFGPDGKADPTAAMGVGANKDNILSWDR